MLKKYMILIAFPALFLLHSCEDPITGYGPQPEFLDEHKHKPMLNVFGVLRPEKDFDIPLSYVHLEAAYSVTSDYPDSFIIVDAEVKLLNCSNTASDSLNLVYTDFDTLFPEKEYRDPDFYPQAGQTYGVSCKKEGFPVLTSKTTMPWIPQIAANSLELNNNELSFSISRDSLAGLYDVYLWIGEQRFASRVLRSETGDTKVNLKYNKGPNGEGTLFIYAYDINLAEYFTAVISAKPNTYQPPVSTVENGYGSFGSMNVLQQVIDLN